MNAHAKDEAQRERPERADVRATVWLTRTIDDQVRARMAAEGRRSISDFLRALIARGLGLTGGGGGGG